MENAKDRKGGEWKDSQLTVAVRVRPMRPSEVEASSSIAAQPVDDNIVVLLDPMEDPDDILRAHRSREKHYVFDRAFGEQASQETVYIATTKSLIQSVVQGYNATVFAYGATGAGKTYTMLGTDHEPGIMARALNDLFKAMDAKSQDSVYKVTMSYLEIYNEMIRDLLNPASGFLDLREDASGNVQVAGISKVSTVSTNEVMTLLMEGNKERTQEPTAANKTSSRSHAVLQVTIKECNRLRAASQNIRTGKLFMIDLAGSERAAQTKNRGKRMIEGAHINRSLLALGNCINALCEGGKYVNYRDSKLTRILKDALGGNCKTVMIATISPASIFFEESRNTLLYADRAKNIKMKIRPNLSNVTYHIVQYTNIITELRQEIVRLQKKIADQDHLKKNAPHTQGTKSDEAAAAASSRRGEMDRLRHQLIANFQHQMGIRQSMMGLENRKWEVAVEINHQMATITEWEQERSRMREMHKDIDNRFKERDQEKETDTDSTTSETPEPDDIINAREAIAELVCRQNQLSMTQRGLEVNLKTFRSDANKLEEVLPKTITSEEQGEILSMLCKVHELEIENTELKSEAFIHRHTAEQRESLMRRYEKHRLLCDKIIQEQRLLINKHGVFRPQQLEDWYEQYTAAVFEDMTFVSTNPNLQSIREIKATSVLNLQALKALQEGNEDPSPEKESVDVKTPPRGNVQLQEDSGSTGGIDQPRVFNPSPRAHQLRHKSQTASLPKIKMHAGSPSLNNNPPLTKHESLETLNDHGRNGLLQRHHLASNHYHRSTSPPLKEDRNGARSLEELDFSESSDHDGRSNRKEIVQRTKNIAAIAAQKRNTQKQFERTSASTTSTGWSHKLDRPGHQALGSLRSVHEVTELDNGEDYMTLSRLSKHSTIKLVGGSQGSPGYPNNDDDISIITVDRRSDATETYSTINARNTRYKGSSGAIVKRLTEKQAAEKRRRRGLGYESSGHVMYMPSRGGYNRAYPPLERGKRLGFQPTQLESHPTSKVKYPIVHHAGEQDATMLGSVSTPTNLHSINQLGAERGRGQTLQKRARGAFHNDTSNRSTPQLPTNKQANTKRHPPSYPVYQRKTNLAVAGFGVPRKERMGSRRL